MNRKIKTVLICDSFEIYDRTGCPTGKTEFVVGAAYDYESGRAVIAPSEHPTTLGGVHDATIGEWVIYANER